MRATWHVPGASMQCPAGSAVPHWPGMSWSQIRMPYRQEPGVGGLHAVAVQRDDAAARHRARAAASGRVVVADLIGRARDERGAAARRGPSGAAALAGSAVPGPASGPAALAAAVPPAAAEPGATAGRTASTGAA